MEPPPGESPSSNLGLNNLLSRTGHPRIGGSVGLDGRAILKNICAAAYSHELIVERDLDRAAPPARAGWITNASLPRVPESCHLWTLIDCSGMALC